MSNGIDDLGLDRVSESEGTISSPGSGARDGKRSYECRAAPSLGRWCYRDGHLAPGGDELKSQIRMALSGEEEYERMAGSITGLHAMQVSVQVSIIRHDDG